MASMGTAIAGAEVVAGRDGLVLSSNSILKQDRLYEPQNWGAVALAGCPNFRFMEEESLGAMGACTVNGLRTAINIALNTTRTPRITGVPKVVIVNLRESPVVFLGENSFVLRSKDTPFSNYSSLRGISPKRLESMERRLADDVLAEAKKFSSLVLTHEEFSVDGERVLRASLVPGNKNHVRTYDEVVASLNKEMENVEIIYRRIPCTPGDSPEPIDYRRLVSLLRKTPDHTPIIFQDQLGRGRCTHFLAAALSFRRMLRPETLNVGLLAPSLPTAILAHPSSPSPSPLPQGSNSSGLEPITTPVTLATAPTTIFAPGVESTVGCSGGVSVGGNDGCPLPQKRSGASSRYPNIRISFEAASGANDVAGSENRLGALAGPSILALHSLKAPSYRSQWGDVRDDLLDGDYISVTRVLSTLPRGRGIKAHLDSCVDAVGHVLNIRTSIYKHRQRAEGSEDPAEARVHLARSASFLKRYLSLLLFTAYARRCAQVHYKLRAPGSDGEMTAESPARAFVTATPQDILMSNTVPSADPPVIHGSAVGDDEEVAVESESEEEDEYAHLPVSFPTFAAQRSFVTALIDNIKKAPGDALVPAVPESSVEEESLLSARNGTLLHKGMLLTSDSSGTPEESLVGAGGLAQLGVSWCGAVAAQNVTQVLKGIKAEGHTAGVWVNMRQVTVYLNGQPYSLREAAHPQTTISYLSRLDQNHVETLEKRLAAEVKAELALSATGSRRAPTIVTHGLASFSLTQGQKRGVRGVRLEVSRVQTPKEFFGEIFAEVEAHHGLAMAYHRIPCQDDLIFVPEVYDSLLASCLTPYPSGRSLRRVHFHDSHGVGRASVAATVGVMVRSKVSLELTASPSALLDSAALGLDMDSVASPSPAGPATPSIAMEDKKKKKGMGGRTVTSGTAGRSLESSASGMVQATASSNANNNGPVERNGVMVGTQGMYEGVVRLLRVLGSHGGLECKLEVDAAMRMVGMEDRVFGRLRRVLESFDESGNVDEKHELVNRGSQFLRMYMGLVMLNSHLRWMKAGGEDTRDAPTFDLWYSSRPEIVTILERMHHDGASVLRTVKSSDLSSRTGAILGPSSMLKLDHFPHHQRDHIPVIHLGAPNFRAIANGNTTPQVCGLAIPSVSGLMALTSHLVTIDPQAESFDDSAMETPVVGGHMSYLSVALRGVARTAKKVVKRTPLIVYCSLREEPVSYINGHPYVIREASSPFKNLEHTGITRERLEDQENQLKKEIIKESTAAGGKLLLHDEEDNGDVSSHTAIVPGAESVLTPLELFTQVKDGGVRLRYTRLPVTDEEAPTNSTWNHIVAWFLPHIAFAQITGAPTVQIVTQCQLGRGRTTTAMICASLIALNTAKTPAERAKVLRGISGEPEPEEDLSSALSSALSSLSSPEESAAASEKKRNVEVVGRFTPPPAEVQEDHSDPNYRYLCGDYRAVRMITRVLPEGLEAKEDVDAIIDAASDMQNLRTSVLAFRLQVLDSGLSEKKRLNASVRGEKYLTRYFRLVLMAAYLRHLAGLGHIQSVVDHVKKCVVGAPLHADGTLEFTEEMMKLPEGFLSFELWLSSRDEVSSIENLCSDLKG